MPNSSARAARRSMIRRSGVFQASAAAFFQTKENYASSKGGPMLWPMPIGLGACIFSRALLARFLLRRMGIMTALPYKRSA